MSENLIWEHYFARKFSASRFEVVMRVFFSKYYKRKFNAHLHHSLVIPGPGINHTICYIDSEWKEFAQKVYRGVCSDLKTFKYYGNLIKQTQLKSLRVAKNIVRQPLTKLSWQQLGLLWHKWDQAHLDHFLKPIWIPFIIEPLLSADAKEIHENLIIKNPQYKEAEALGVVFGPDFPNAINLERAGLIKIALLVINGKIKKKTINRKITRHANKYGFIPCYDVIDKPWDERYFRKSLNSLIKDGRHKLVIELRKINQSYKKRRWLFKMLIKKIRASKEDKGLLQMVHDIIYIKDERDDYRRRQSYTIQPLFQELARRFKLPVRGSLYLIREEMLDWFSTGKLPVTKTEIKQRMAGYCLLSTNNRPVKIMSGQKMRKFLHSQKFNLNSGVNSAVRGLIGNQGLVRGSVCLVYTKHDLKKVVAGDIMVAVTTNPDYVPAMRRCKAFVTDEGGITSHAAIVAREMSKPCIIGTKVATRTFIDGDLVEVDANKGIVKILKRK